MDVTHIAFIAKQQVPLEFNTLVIREDGSLERHCPGRPVEFSFTYRGIPFAVIAQVVGQHPVLYLTGEVGPVPYSAESIPIRRAVHAVLRSTWSLPHSRLVAGPNARIRAVGEIPLREPLTPVALITAVAVAILELKPYLEILADHLPKLGGPAAKPGRVAAVPPTAAGNAATPLAH